VIFEDGPIRHNDLLWLAFTNLADLDSRLVGCSKIVWPLGPHAVVFRSAPHPTLLANWVLGFSRA
jgi:hypothetical protein